MNSKFKRIVWIFGVLNVSLCADVMSETFDNVVVEGNVTAKALFLSENTYGSRLGLCFGIDSIWGISSEYVPRVGPIAKRNLFVSADTVFVADNLEVKNSVKAYSGMKVGDNFSVLPSGEVYAPSLHLVSSSKELLYVNFLGGSIGWKFSTNYFSSDSKTGVAQSPLTFDANSYNFKSGRMTVDSSLICKDTMTANEMVSNGNITCEKIMKSSEIQTGGLKIFDNNGTPKVALNNDGNMTALGLVLHVGSANNDTYYGPIFSIKCDDYKIWDILANNHKLGGNDTMNVRVSADSFMVDRDMVVGNSLSASDLSVGNGCHIFNDGSISTSGALTLSSLTGGVPFPSWRVEMENGAWLTSTRYNTPNGAGGYPMVFDAFDYTFKNGNMIVEGTITCKDSLKVAEVKTDNLRAKNVTVDMGDAADYVFDENYDLKPLGEVEAYVKANKHLPGIPSASQMKEEGMNVSEMSNLLLEKIEELTLHVIRLEKENQELKSEMKAMKSGK